MRAILVVALLALFACTFTVAQEAAVAPRFAEAEHEDAATLAEQEADWSAMVSADTEEADEADEGEAEEEADEEVEEEAGEEADEEAEEEADEESEEEEADEAEDESEEESEEEADEEAEDHSEYVLAELKDNAVMTGFMEMISSFVPTAAVAANHMVHSLSSHQQAAADQQYAYGYAHGHADATINAAKDQSEDEEETTEGEEAETEAEADEAESSFVEGSAKAEEQHPYYPAAYYGYPSVAGVYYQPHYPTPGPPQLPTWLPPPPYITPVAEKDKSGGGDE